MSFSAILPNLTKDGSNPFENLSEKLNQNRDEFFDGFLMGDLAGFKETAVNNSSAPIRHAALLVWRLLD